MSKNLNKVINNNEKQNNFEKIDYKKSLGQNFLYDINLLKAIAKDGDVEADDIVLEIGAGAGTLTEVLAQNAFFVLSNYLLIF